MGSRSYKKRIRYIVIGDEMKIPTDLKLEKEIIQNDLIRNSNSIKAVLLVTVLLAILYLDLNLNFYLVGFIGASIFVFILVFFYRYGDSYKICIYDKGVKFSSYGLPKKFEDMYVNFKEIKNIHKEKKRFLDNVLIVEDIYGNKYEVKGLNLNKILPYLHKNLEERWDYVYKGRGV